MGSQYTLITCCIAFVLAGTSWHCFGACVHDKFDCGDGHCIPLHWRCDGDTDCKNGADEMSCDAYTCSSDQFSCDDGACVPMKWRCDGNRECKNGEDEINCTASTTVSMSPMKSTTMSPMTSSSMSMAPQTQSTAMMSSALTTMMPSVTSVAAVSSTKKVLSGKDPNCDDFQVNCHVLVNEIDICTDSAIASLLCASTCHMCNGMPSVGGFPTRGPTTSTTTTTTTTRPRPTHDPYTAPGPRPDGGGSSCQDLEDNCDTLVSSVNICSNKEKATFLCPATCLICDGGVKASSTVTGTTQAMVSTPSTVPIVSTVPSGSTAVAGTGTPNPIGVAVVGR